MAEPKYCKRLIEVDLPIKQISEQASREKSIRHGHISTLHIWWARRPLAACRAVICAALWPDPLDPLCPERFRKEVANLMEEFRNKRGGKPRDLKNNMELRQVLLDFIAEFSNWDNSSIKDFLYTSRAITKIAHETLDNVVGTKPLVVDPFAGGGSIPLEALRVGADSFASDLNPIPVLLNKVVLEYVPKYGERIAQEIHKWGEWIKEEAKKELISFYPKASNSTVPIAYLWARTIQCEGPGCGAEVPLLRSLWLSKKPNRSVAIQLKPHHKNKKVEFCIITKQSRGWVEQTDSDIRIEKPNFDGTVKRGSVLCPCCGYTTPVSSVRRQLKKKEGGTSDAKLFCVIETSSEQQGRSYRLPKEVDLKAVYSASKRLKNLEANSTGLDFKLIPNETIPLMSGVFNVPLYGHSTWGSLFNERQKLALAVFSQLIHNLDSKITNIDDPELLRAVRTCLAMCFDRLAMYCNALCFWHLTGEKVSPVFGRQALGMSWDFLETNVFSSSSGGWESAVSWVESVISFSSQLNLEKGHVQQASATEHPLPNDSAQAFVTDPPYYNAVPYADLSDFFYVWLRRMIGSDYPDLFNKKESPKELELCEMAGWDPVRYSNKNKDFFEKGMTLAAAEGRRVLSPNGIGVIVFAHKSTIGWEAILKAIIDGGWIITGSWPIDTEMKTRLRAHNSATLSSSIHLVCRPRENSDGSVRMQEIGDWRDVLQELPKRIHEWMPRLAKESVVGADAIFACLGPALEIFSKYSHVEKANGEKVELKEYLEQVWAAVAKEALNMIFEGARTEGFEEDARLTAMWLWTLSTGTNGDGKKTTEDTEEAAEDSELGSDKISLSGFSLEFDAARKIAQGLGAHLENLNTIIEIEGEQARLLSVAERVKTLFGKDSSTTTTYKKKKKDDQSTLFPELEEIKANEWSLGDNKASVGKTVLDRLHQAMILFGAGRGEALRRFLVEEGVGKDDRLWRLAQALSALYPTNTDEKRWVDGVLAKKKSFGF